MSCYFRHLKNILNEAGIEVNADNRKQIDQAIHQIVEVSYKDCPATWKNLKHQILVDDEMRQAFVSQLQNAIH